MVFSSLNFLYLFLPVCLLLYFIIPKLKYKNIVLLIMSLLFYAWGEPKWIIVMILMAFVDYFAGLMIAKNADNRRRKKFWLVFSVVVSVAALGIFKYTGFVIDNINAVFGSSIADPPFVLPIGISFYTFQALSYTIDVYRGKTQVQLSYYKFLLYVSMFPQLIAGPIVRYADVAAQIDDRRTTLPGFLTGINRFSIGLAKKVLLANIAGQLVTGFIGGDLANTSVLGAWAGIFFYALQIYFDFSGYSDMAIGLGKMFGFDYLENFNYPYISKSITEFWRRWHMSLSTFFRDYVYIPLGGNRKHMVLNMLIVWALTGLWHGANWNFLLWGLYYFVFLTIEKLFLGKYIEKVPILRNLYALFIILIGWVFFYFEDMGRMGEMFSIMFGFSGHMGTAPTDTTILMNHLLFIILAVIACIPVRNIAVNGFQALSRRTSAGDTVRVVVTIIFDLCLLFLSTASLVGASYNPFLYFRF